MSSFDSTSKAMKALSETNDSTPLLTEDDILHIIRIHSVTEKPHSSVLKYTIISLLLAAASVATVFFLPRQAEESFIKELPNTNQVLVQEDVSHPDEQTIAKAIEQEEHINNTTPSAEQDHARHTKPVQLLKTISLTETELQRLGLQVSESQIVYSELVFRITIKTNGIAAKGLHKPNSQLIPKHVTIYRNSVAFASWFEAKNQLDVDRLVAVKVHLRNSSNTMFPEADVLFWYEPNEEFLHALPQRERQHLLNDFSNTTRESESAAHQAQNTSIAASAIFPNPATSAATISLTLNRECVSSASLYNAAGSKLADLWTDVQHRVGRVDLPLTNLESYTNGMYLIVIEIHGEPEHVIQRLLIQR